jgi:hypothetical protein
MYAQSNDSEDQDHFESDSQQTPDRSASSTKFQSTQVRPIIVFTSTNKIHENKVVAGLYLESAKINFKRVRLADSLGPVQQFTIMQSRMRPSLSSVIRRGMQGTKLLRHPRSNSAVFQPLRAHAW